MLRSMRSFSRALASGRPAMEKSGGLAISWVVSNSCTMIREKMGRTGQPVGGRKFIQADLGSIMCVVAIMCGVMIPDVVIVCYGIVSLDDTSQDASSVDFGLWFGLPAR